MRFFYHKYRTVNSQNNKRGNYEVVGQKGNTFSSTLVLLLPIIGFILLNTQTYYDIYIYSGIGFWSNVFVVLVAAIVFFMQKHKLEKAQLEQLLFMLLVITYTICSAIYAGGGFRYASVVINTMFASFVIGNSTLSKRSINIGLIILVVMVIVAILSAGNYFTKQYLISNSINSNILAYFGLAEIIYGYWFLYFIDKRNKIIIKILKLFFAITSFYIIYQCQSRGSLLAWVFFMVAVYLLPYKLWTNKRLLTMIILGIVITGIVFSLYYVNNFAGSNDLFMGKRTASRIRIWGYFWRSVENGGLNNLFGWGTHSPMRSIFEYGAHNVYLTLWYDIGIIGLLLFLSYSVLNVKQIFLKKKILPIQAIAIIGFLSFMIYDYFGDEFLGCLAAWTYTMLGLAHQNKVYMDTKAIVIA